MKAIASTIALAVLVIVVTVGSIGGCVAVTLPHGSYGLTLDWRHADGSPPILTVVAVAPNSSAAAAGIAPGDTVVSTPSFDDRIVIALQSSLFGGTILPPGMPVAFTLEHRGTQRAVQLVAATGAIPHGAWLRQLRQIIYLLAVFVVAAFVFVRPNVITWSFALFVILAAQPSLSMLRWVGTFRAPVAFLVANSLVQAFEGVGYIGLVAFAARFPGYIVQRGYLAVERFAFAVVAVSALAWMEKDVGRVFGWPSLEGSLIEVFGNLVPLLVAIAFLARTYVNAEPSDRARLRWAIVGPAVGMLFIVSDLWAKDLFRAPDDFPVILGLLTSVAPFSMMYAIVRHHVIDVPFALNQTLARAISAPDGVRGHDAQRDLVRRSALLLSADVPLAELYDRLAELLAEFVGAANVIVAIGEANDLRVAYASSAVGAPTSGAASLVLSDGQPRVYARAREWPTRANAESAVFVPVGFGGATIGVLGVQSSQPEAYDEEDVATLETCALYLGARIHDERQRARGAELRALATTDGLTRLANRRAFDEALEREWARCSRSASTIGLLLLDVDFFKVFNDAYGHVAGDACLRQVASAIAACVKRPGDVVARYGGEEFAVVLTDVDAAGTAHLGEAICDAVRALALPHEGSSLGRVTVSVGFAIATPDAAADPLALVSKADRALYRAKNGGRNRVAGDGYESAVPEVQQRVVVRHNLPPTRTAFVGRSADLARVEETLAGARLLTIVGAGGVGKTRIALEVARRVLQKYSDGVWFVDLGPITSEETVTRAVATIVFPGVDGSVSIDRLGELMHQKRLCVVLDNCEHVIDACAQLADAVLSAAPGVRFLATSREPLAVEGEVVYRLPSLGEADAVELLIERVRGGGRELMPDEVGIAQRIVAQLDGIPLAIELAAGRLSTLTAQELLQGLSDRLGMLSSESRDAPSRQQTLHALLDWSYRLLPDREQAVFRRLAVFSGGWTLGAATSVCTTGGVSAATVADALEALVLKSLAVREDLEVGSRYRFLETTREFAMNVLEESGEFQAVAGRHVAYFATYAAEAAASRTTSTFGRWFALQRVEFENYASAMRRALGPRRDDDAATAILKPLAGLLLDSETFAEFVLPIRMGLERAGLHARVRAVYWLALGELLRLRKPMDSLDAAERAIALFLQAGDESSAAYALWLVAGAQLRGRGAIDRSLEPHLLDAIAVARRDGDRRLSVGLLRSLAYVRSESGATNEARAALYEAAEIVDRSDVAMLTSLVGSTAFEEFREGNVDTAISLWRQAAALAEEARPAFASMCFINVGLGELMRGDPMSARVMLQKGLEGVRASGHQFGIAQSFDRFARLAKELGDHKRAARMAGFAQASFERGPRRPSLEQRSFDELVADLRKRLGSDTFETEWKRGGALSLDGAVSEAYAA